MGYAAILVHVRADKDSERSLACACALAKTFDAALVGVGAEMFAPLAPDYGYYALQGEWFGIMRKAADENLERARKTFNAATAGLGIPTLWESGLRLPIEAIAEASRGADLIVAGRAHRKSEGPYEVAPTGELVIAAGRPVLVTPSKGAPLAGDHVVLAWKETRETRRALSDAMPFFVRAKAVLVLEICGKDDVANAEIRTSDVVAALKRHGVSATAKVVEGHGDAHRLGQEADAFGANLIVAGGYGHSRLGEWVFGGVTHDLLGQDKHYVLLSH